MKPLLPLFVFIDACGWEIVRNDPFVADFAPNRKRLKSVFGYSSACVPSILSGRWPDEHRNWSYFVYDPVRSPFKRFSWLRFLPRRITSRRIFRRQLSRLIKRQLNFRGYFDIYNIPFETIGSYDFTEKRSPLQPGGMNSGPNIFDYLQTRSIPYHVSRPEESEEGNLEAIIADIHAGEIEFAFVYWPGLDALLHRVGNQSTEIGPKLRQYERWIGKVMGAARQKYQDVQLFVFSDHGMANCDVHVDLRKEILSLPARCGRDYAAVYDSTMARFWFFGDSARQSITNYLSGLSYGRIVHDPELAELGTFFPDRYFGELIFLVNEGVLIVPSDMGERPIRAMHGYHPADKHSYAVVCTNHPSIPDEVTSIVDMYRLMAESAEEAHARAHGKTPVPSEGTSRKSARTEKEAETLKCGKL